jgi:2-iminobutanoate/2-iminopropanoate deaminase
MNPKDQQKSRGFYSPAVRAGDFLFVSGQLPTITDDRVEGTITNQTQQALANLRAVLLSHDQDITSVVQCTVYISDMALWPEVNTIYGDFFSQVPIPPARAMVPVKTMHYGALIEIQAVAYVGNRDKGR